MTESEIVPFLDLVSSHEGLEQELVTVFKEALKSGRFIGGPMVEEFEKEFAGFCGTAYCVGVNSGTDALRFALTASGVRQGDMVITVPNTFIATAEAISQAGAQAEFVDVDERTYTIDCRKLADYIETQCSMDNKAGRPISKRTGRPVSAVIPVHLYGQTADMDSLIELAERYRLLVVEDACQAHGAEYFSERERRWRKAGSLGAAGAFSFYPGKNLGACGEGGAVTTNSEEIASKVRMLRDHGQSRKYFHEVEGYNGRLDAIQAGVLSIKLQHLPEWTERRRICAQRYDELLGNISGVVTPFVPLWTKHVYHLYIIRSGVRDELMRLLSESNIGTGLHYPLPLHLQAAYGHLKFRQGDFPVSERLASEILSLPMYPGLTEQKQKYVAEKIIEAVDTITAKSAESDRKAAGGAYTP